MKQQLTSTAKTTNQGFVTGGVTTATGLQIAWQDGPLRTPTDNPEYPFKSHPPNGAFLQTVVQAAIDRLQLFQNSPTRCRENAVAITHLETALLWLNKREQDREERGVLGRHVP